MDILLIVATLVVAVAGLYVAATFNRRTRANFTPLIDGALQDVTGQIEELRGRIRTITDDLQQDRDQARLDARKIQGRLDHMDSRMTSLAHEISTELDTIRRLVEQLAQTPEEDPEPAHEPDTAEISSARVPSDPTTWWEHPPSPSA
jgi:signal transduction histidine kinase